MSLLKRLRLSTGFAFVAALMLASAATAQTTTGIDEDAGLTIPGLRIKTDLVLDGSSTPSNFLLPPVINSAGRPLYQQIDPCRIISSLAQDQLTGFYGKQAFLANERRTYTVLGLLFPEVTNPCSTSFPLTPSASHCE